MFSTSESAGMQSGERLGPAGGPPRVAVPAPSAKYVPTKRRELTALVHHADAASRNMSEVAEELE